MGRLPLLLLGILLIQLPFNLGAKGKKRHIQANTPPRGWNSYDAFSWIVTEEEFLQNAAVVSKRLRHHGYKYVVVDFLWYRKNVLGASQSAPGFDIIDEWGRLVPDPVRWPSTKGGKGFKPIADIVHRMGLKFGIHVMRGISFQAVNANTPILGSKGLPYMEGGRNWTAQDIGLVKEACPWMPKCFMSVNLNLGAGRAFLRSLYTQYVEWEVDFVKHDCVFGDNLKVDEIRTVSKIIRETGRSIVYSLSPGGSVTPRMAKEIRSFVNMYRLTNDDWDNFNDLYLHFNVSRDFSHSNLMGKKGLMGKSWPDLDMLPFGSLTDPGANYGPYRSTNLTLDEQKSQITLWAMAKSPLMFGGDLRTIDHTTFDLITNPTLLKINSFSSNNSQVAEIYSPTSLDQGGTSFDARNKKGSELELKAYSCKRAEKNSHFFERKQTNQICWKRRIVKSDSYQCFYRNTNIPPLMKHYGKFNILESPTINMCFDASPSHMTNSRNVKSYYFSPCDPYKLTQLWELRGDGALYNNYTGLCAQMKSLIGASDVNEVRIWKSFGKKGEVYIAYFNVSPRRLKLSITQIEKEMGTTAKSSLRHTYHEVWSGKKLGVGTRKNNIIIPSHGVVLFQYREFN